MNCQKERKEIRLELYLSKIYVREYRNKLNNRFR
jgi:hypothetical protein